GVESQAAGLARHQAPRAEPALRAAAEARGGGGIAMAAKVKVAAIVERLRGLLVEYWPIARLLPYIRNARTHSPEQIAQVAASIRQFGWTNPILVGADGVVIAGHARLMAARQLGMTEVPVIQLGHLSEGQRHFVN